MEEKNEHKINSKEIEETFNYSRSTIHRFKTSKDKRIKARYDAFVEAIKKGK